VLADDVGAATVAVDDVVAGLTEDTAADFVVGAETNFGLGAGAIVGTACAGAGAGVDTGAGIYTGPGVNTGANIGAGAGAGAGAGVRARAGADTGAWTDIGFRPLVAMGTGAGTKSLLAGAVAAAVLLARTVAGAAGGGLVAILKLAAGVFTAGPLLLAECSSLILFRSGSCCSVLVLSEGLLIFELIALG